MQTRTLGQTGLQVTVLSYGAMAVSNKNNPTTDEQAEQVLGAVLDAGINFVDTSPDYGKSEKRIGKFIAHRRSEYYLATKCGCNVPRGDDPDAAPHIWTRDQLMHNIELSLRRLKTDYVDVWQLHNASVDDVQQGDLVAAMQQVKEQGKVRHVSISSTLPHITTFTDQGAFETYQIPYSALQRDEENTITAAAQSGAGTIIRGGVAQGEPGHGRGDQDRWDLWKKANLDELRSADESPSAFLLRFTITHPHMHTTIVGTKSPDHLKQNLAAAEAGPLTNDVYDQVKRRLAAAGEKPGT